MMQDLQKAVIKFRDERNWGQFHNAKDLAISLNLEAAELLETFQWKSSEEATETKMQEMKEEMADVMIYLLMLSDKLNIDLEEAVYAKLLKNAEKYPVEKAFGSNKKYDEL
ncbi:NTP pyrophosphatase (non-canonical NTP hydrolase) [Bacillus sp. RC51]